MSNDFVKQGYNKAAEHYAASRDQFENTKYLDKLNALLSSNSHILDIGCGAGKPIDSYFVSKGHSVTGIDLSEKMIDLARENVPEASYKVQDMTQLKENDYSVDAVVSFYAIFHTPRETHQELFKKINSFLPTNGLLLVSMGSSEWEGKEENFHGIDMYWSHYDAKKNRKIVENSGFQVILDEIDGTANERHQILMARKIKEIE